MILYQLIHWLIVLTYSDFSFHPINTLKPKDSSFRIIYDKERKQIFTLKELEQEIIDF